MEGDKVRLVVMGLSYNPIRDGAYALILAEMNGPYRIPVVIGSSEAQSIAVNIEKIITPRPLTHDLFISLGHAFGIRLTEVFIYKFEDGIFLSMLTFVNNEGEIVEIDSRTSDAIALALRVNAPIYTTRGLLEETGFVLEKKGPGKGIASGHNSEGIAIQIEWSEDGSNEIDATTMDILDESAPETGCGADLSDLEHLPTDYLQRLLEKAVAQEDYESAKYIKTIIDRKNKEQ